MEKEAVEIVNDLSEEIHVALLDMGMPVLGGAETFPLLKEARPHMRIIIYSGYEPNEASKALLKHGACGFLQKPFRMDNLAYIVRQVLDE